MNYFTGSSIPKWILGTSVDELFTVELDSKICSIKDVLYFKKHGTILVECLILIITDGKYYIPTLVHPNIVRDHLQLSSQLNDQVLQKTLKQTVIIIKRSAVSAFRTGNGAFPYIIALDWEILEGYPEQPIAPHVQQVIHHDKVSSWVQSLNDTIEQQNISKDVCLSKAFQSRLVHRKFADLHIFEPALERFLCMYLNCDNTQEQHVQSVDIANVDSRKQSLNDTGSSQTDKRFKSATPEHSTNTSNVASSQHWLNDNNVRTTPSAIPLGRDTSTLITPTRVSGELSSQSQRASSAPLQSQRASVISSQSQKASVVSSQSQRAVSTESSISSQSKTLAPIFSQSSIESSMSSQSKKPVVVIPNTFSQRKIPEQNLRVRQETPLIQNVNSTKKHLDKDEYQQQIAMMFQSWTPDIPQKPSPTTQSHLTLEEDKIAEKMKSPNTTFREKTNLLRQLRELIFRRGVNYVITT